MSILADVLAILVAVLFAGSGLVEAFRWRSASDQFVAWGYPSYWPIVTSVIKIVGGLLILVPGLRLAGLALCCMVAAAAILTVYSHRTRKLYAPASALTTVILLATLMSAAH